METRFIPTIHYQVENLPNFLREFIQKFKPEPVYTFSKKIDFKVNEDFYGFERIGAKQLFTHFLCILIFFEVLCSYQTNAPIKKMQACRKFKLESGVGNA